MDSAYAGTKALITGGLGFIGSNLAHRLVGLGADVTLVDSLIPEYGGNLQNVAQLELLVRINIADVRDEHSMRYLVQGVDYLFNLAGQTSHLDSMRDPFPDLEINARAQLSILEACRHYNPEVRIVFASTRQIYGKPEYLPVDERHPVQPVDVNGINKVAGEQYHLVYHSAYGLRTTCLRLTNTYGPRMRVKDARQTFVGIWVRNVLTGVPIQVYGDGSQVRDLAYVDDIVEAFLLSALREESVGAVLNIGGADRITLLELAELMIERRGGGSLELVPFPEAAKAIDIGDFYTDDRLARELLEWCPRVGIADGITRTFDYYERFGGAYFT